MDICYCYEKFKKDLPEGVKTTCFKEKCANYRKNTKSLKENRGDRTSSDR